MESRRTKWAECSDNANKRPAAGPPAFLSGPDGANSAPVATLEAADGERDRRGEPGEGQRSRNICAMALWQIGNFWTKTVLKMCRDDTPKFKVLRENGVFQRSSHWIQPLGIY